jgi:hypothetical protein
VELGPLFSNGTKKLSKGRELQKMVKFCSKFGVIVQENGLQPFEARDWVQADVDFFFSPPLCPPPVGQKGQKSKTQNPKP